MANFFPQIDSKIGKDITNFVSGYYDNTGTTKRGYVYCYPDGVWSDAKNILVGYLKNNVFIYRMALTLTDINSSMYTLRKKTYSYIGSTDTYTEVTGSGNKITKKIISSELASQQLSNNTQLIEAITSFGAELNDYTEFCNWIETKAYSIDMIDGMISLDDTGYYKVNFANTKIYFTEKEFTRITSEQNILPIYLYWYTEIKGLTLKKGISTDDKTLNVKFISEWTLYVDGVNSNNPIFYWKWVSASMEHYSDYISTEESQVILEYGTEWNLLNNTTKEVILSWDNQPFILTLEDLWANTNSKPSVLEDIFTQAYKRKIYFKLKSKCGEYISDGIEVHLWESGKLNSDIGYPDGVVLLGDDTFRYLEGQPPTDNDNGDNTENNGGGTGDYETPNSGNPSANVQGGTTYFITPTTFNAIKQWLWNANFLDNIKLINNNPIENIISIKYFPFSRSGTSNNIILGNVDTGYTGDMVSNTVYTSNSSPYVTVPTYYNNFLDYAPFTTVKIHLPFVGIKELDTNIVMGRSLECRYIIDCVLGQIEWDIMLNGRVMYSYTGSCGMDIPISSQNRSEVEMGYIASAVTTSVSLVTGNVIGGVMGILNGASQQYKTETSGNYNPSLQMFSNYDIYLIVERPTISIPSNYGHTNGYPFNKGEYIKNVSGFTICENVDVTGTTATDDEKAQIKAILESGFYA